MTITDPAGLPTLSIVTNEDDDHTAVFSCEHGIVEAATPTLKPRDADRSAKVKRGCGCEAERIEYYWPTHEARVEALDGIGPYFGLESLKAMLSDSYRPTDCGCDSLPGIAWQGGMIGPITAHAPDCPEPPTEQTVRMRFIRRGATD